MLNFFGFYLDITIKNFFNQGERNITRLEQRKRKKQKSHLTTFIKVINTCPQNELHVTKKCQTTILLKLESKMKWYYFF